MSRTKIAISLYPSDFDLVEKDQFFNTVIQRSLSGILIFQEDRIIFSNPAFQDIVGLTQAEILRTNPFDLVHPADRDLVKRRAERRMKGLSPPDNYEFRLLTADGRTRWVQVLATSIMYLGRPSVLADVQNIDDRKRADETRLKAERLRTVLLDTLPHPAMLIRRDRTVVAANQSALELGARIGGICNHHFGHDNIGGDSPADLQTDSGSRSAFKSTICRFCRADRALDTMVPQNLRAMEVFGGLWDLFWIPADSDTYLHYAIDVTEQHAIERAIRDSEERYRLVTDTMTDGLSIQDREGIITSVNRRLCEMTDFSRNELIGRPLSQLLGKRDKNPDLVSGSRGDGEGLVPEIFLYHKSGRKIAVSLKIDSLMDDSGNLKGNYAFFSDISELQMLRRHRALTSGEFENIIGADPGMHKLFAEIVEVATCDFPVLIQGESGVGKELVAQAVHNQSNRKGNMFVPVNCAALPEGLLESELFGHVRGAFTGALRDKKGRFELAHGGTIFLDEIGELSMAMQVKLLRILQEGAFERVGDQYTTKVDVRIISATNKHLEREMNAGRFRADLFYRLCVMPILVPPLRERKSDIPLLADHFISTIADRMSGAKPSLSTESLGLLTAYDWPGNVRELQNAIQMACVKCKGRTIQPMHLPSSIGSRALRPIRRRRRQRKLDQDALQEALRRTGGNKLQAAKLLGVNRSTLYRFLAATHRD